MTKKPLRISHLTSKKQLAETLSYFQSHGDIQVSCHLLNTKESVNNEELTRDLKNTDVLHLHGIDLLSNQVLLDLIAGRNKNKEVVVLSLFEDTGNHEVKLKDSILKNSDLLNETSAVFIQDSSLLPVLDSLFNWTWCASPITSPVTDPSESDFEPTGEIKFLYHEGLNDSEFKRQVENTFAKLKEEGLTLRFTSFKSSEMTEDQAFKIIESCDVLIDCNTSPALNRYSLTAFSLGKTVLANVPENSGILSKQFEYAPFLKTDAANIYYRMKSLCMERKSLRDFGRRGVRYILDYHNPKEICSTYLEIYRQFI